MGMEEGLFTYKSFSRAPAVHQLAANLVCQIGIDPSVTEGYILATTGLEIRELRAICQYAPIREYIEHERAQITRRQVNEVKNQVKAATLAQEILVARLEADKEHLGEEGYKPQVSDKELIKLIELSGDRVKESALSKRPTTQRIESTTRRVSDQSASRKNIIDMHARCRGALELAAKFEAADEPTTGNNDEMVI